MREGRHDRARAKLRKDRESLTRQRISAHCARVSVGSAGTEGVSEGGLVSPCRYRWVMSPSGERVVKDYQH